MTHTLEPGFGMKGQHMVRTSRLPFVGAAVAVALALAGCASSGSDARPAVTPAVSETSMTGGAVDTGTFPNLNIPPKTANTQITPEEKATRIAELNDAKQRQAAAGAGGVPIEDPLLLKKKAATHGDETLKAIEGN